MLSSDKNKTPDNIDAALRILWKGLDQYRLEFSCITRKAGQRFEQRDWQGLRQDTVQRLDLYPRVVSETAALMKQVLPADANSYRLWSAIQKGFRTQCQIQCDAEIAATFYNSVHRKVFSETGVDARLTFVAPLKPRLHKKDVNLFFQFDFKKLQPENIQALLTHFPFQTPFQDIETDARRCAMRIGEIAGKQLTRDCALQIKMFKSPFFRGMSAYLVGKMQCGQQWLPLVFCLDHEEGGIRVDALLSTPEQLRILFSFSRAYFHVDTPCPGAIVSFLKELMPEKRIAEIYIGLGYHKHGKTELYRDLLRHQQVCSLDRFDFSPGKHGMVMIAFNMPNDNLIYKLIRDRFDTPKKTTAGQVIEKYDYVFRHDRAGRLVDVQTFENLELEACCFTPELLSEIQTQATQAATVSNGRVILHHTYVGRRVTPLDLFLKQADPDTAEEIIKEYGQAIKDLARINIFPGDMLIKNFGVTGLGRVVFYDYDELCPLLDCNFRKLPQARQYEDELNSEPWFMVDEHDVFPEEFTAFLGLSPPLRKVFLKYHGDLLEPGFWQQTQEHIRSATFCHIRPYGTAQRLQDC